MGLPPSKKNMRKGYDYPNRLLFREKLVQSGRFQQSTAYNYETAIVNPSNTIYVKAQMLWLELMPTVPLPQVIEEGGGEEEEKLQSQPSTPSSSPPVKIRKKDTLTKKMLKGWMHNVFSEAETLEFLADLWLQDEI